MSWIKKLFQMFKNEDENEEFEYIEEQNHFHEPNPNQKQYTAGSKEVTAKIVYQYPNGQFRFPLIPDEDEKLGKREKGRIRTEKTQNRASSAVQKKSIPPKEEKTKLDRNRQVVANKNRQPFRPTEIPSPIYGYGRRKSEQKVEYELTDFNNRNSKNEEVYPYSNGIKSSSQKHRFNDDEKRNIPLTEKLHGNSISALPEEEKHYNMINDNHAVAELANLELASHDAAIKENVSRFSCPNEETENEAYTVDQPVTDHIDMYGASQNEIQDIEIRDTVIQNTEIQDTEIQDNEMQDTEIHGRELSAERETSAQEISAALADETASERAPLPERKRSHLPFNVIMLKQDKRKIEQKRLREQREQTERLQNNFADFQQKSPADELRQNQTVEKAINATVMPVTKAGYEFPALNLLTPPVARASNTAWLLEQEQLLNQTLENFNVGAKVVNVTQGPSVTRFEVQPDPGVKVNKITNLSDDIKLSLAARDIRIEAPIPGKHTIGIEVPNHTSRPVLISEIIQSPEFLDCESPLTAVLGLDISGKPIVTDLKKMPHGLIAGATGSGKSVCINTILVSLLYKANPEDVKLVLIDPKMVELAPYNQIPHLVSPVITDVKAATAALKWAVEEMERRYELFAHTGVRDIHRFNELAVDHRRYSDKLPYIVIVIDELADLMMMAPADVEEAICRIAQKARACGIHLIIATQRPSVDVITGLIKANVPTRIAFSVSSQIDSRTIIDIGGAEKLLGRGDMLFLENGSSKPVRLQGTFVSDIEIDEVVAHIRSQQEPQYLFEQGELLKKAQVEEEEDELFFEACEFVIAQGSASTSSLQRRFKVGYNRAARLIDMMENQGFISETRGSKPRDVLITESDLESLQDTSRSN